MAQECGCGRVLKLSNMLTFRPHALKSINHQVSKSPYRQMIWGSKRKYKERKATGAVKVSRVISIEYLIKPENILPWIIAPKRFPRKTEIWWCCNLVNWKMKIWLLACFPLQLWVHCLDKSPCWTHTFINHLGPLKSIQYRQLTSESMNHFCTFKVRGR